MTDDFDDLIRSSLHPGNGHSSDARVALETLKPAMRRARRRRHIAVGSTSLATLLISIGGVATFASILRSDPAIGPVATPDATLPSIEDHDADSLPIVTTGVSSNENSSEEAPLVSSDDPGVEISVVSTPEVSTTEPDLDTPSPSKAPPATTRPTTTPRNSAPRPTAAPNPAPTTATTVAATSPPPIAPSPTTPPSTAATTTTVAVSGQRIISSSCGSITVGYDARSANLLETNPLAGFSVDVKSNGPKVEVGFAGNDRECEIKAEIQNGELVVDVNDD